MVFFISKTSILCLATFQHAWGLKKRVFVIKHVFFILCIFQVNLAHFLKTTIPTWKKLSNWFFIAIFIIFFVFPNPSKTVTGRFHHIFNVFGVLFRTKLHHIMKSYLLLIIFTAPIDLIHRIRKNVEKNIFCKTLSLWFLASCSKNTASPRHIFLHHNN